MVFVFKDYKRKVASVTAIPMAQLDSIRDWLKYATTFSHPHIKFYSPSLYPSLPFSLPPLSLPLSPLSH